MTHTITNQGEHGQLLAMIQAPQHQQICHALNPSHITLHPSSGLSELVRLQVQRIVSRRCSATQAMVQASRATMSASIHHARPLTQTSFYTTCRRRPSCQDDLAILMRSLEKIENSWRPRFISLLTIRTERYSTGRLAERWSCSRSSSE